MSQDRLQILEGAGFTWRDPSRQRKRSDTRQETWDGFVSQLADFKEEYGHFMVNKVNKTKAKGSKLGRLDEFCSWVRKQYILFKEGSPCQLTEAKTSQLKDMGFWLERGQVKKYTTKKDKKRKMEEEEGEVLKLEPKLVVPKIENEGDSDGEQVESIEQDAVAEESPGEKKKEKGDTDGEKNREGDVDGEKKEEENPDGEKNREGDVDGEKKEEENPDGEKKEDTDADAEMIHTVMV